MAAPLTPPKADEVASSSSSDEVSMNFDEDDTSEVNSTTVGSNGNGAATPPPSNNSSGDFSGSADASISRVNTMPPEILNSERLERLSSEVKLKRSKTEWQRHNNTILAVAEEAAQIFDDKISVRQKRIATVKDDGPVEFEVRGDVEPQTLGVGSENVCNEVDEEPFDVMDLQHIPPLQIVMLIVGTRGDVQPFVAIGKKLQDYGHRVRLATHSNFKEFVLTARLEFYPLGGDPKVLVEYMVKNKGFLPSSPSEISVQRNQIKEIIYSVLPACKEPDLDSGIPFKADAIIANPPAYGHTHVAESLNIPIHIFFTMPWTPTSEFPHPLCCFKHPAVYRLSYKILDALIWLGIRGMINDFRKKKLKLRPVTCLSGSQGSELDIPHGYMWSPHLVPKPKDWGPKVDVVGFCFLDLSTNYEPPESLVNWLKAGPKPIYVGFGSLVHHGGAGTTAAGLKAACPTTIVRFFGDQPFWGDTVHARGVGPPPIPVDVFSLPKLVDAIKFMLDPEVKERAVELAKAMENEDGGSRSSKSIP